jgi:transglutaminase-like putative cysteine protease
VLIATDPPGAEPAPESALQRTVHLQRTAQAGQATKFLVTYELSIYARRFAIDPSRIEPIPALPELAPYLAEEPPHIVFTEALREYSRKVVGDETDSYRIARKLFAAVDEIPWAGAREYSTITNISDYALHAGHADCGQQTLLLIALLRLNGIPARWQSGWVFSEAADDYSNLHDWGHLYLPPYGWVPMDVTTGQLDSEDDSLRWFYFGGLDGYRIAFNDAISTPFVPPTKHFRSDTVDSQRGEAQWRGGNLYYDQWDYGFTATLLSTDAASSTPGERP